VRPAIQTRLLAATEAALPGRALADQQLLADLFHALSQPLTALHCSLELALEARRSGEQCRQGVRTALYQAEQVARWCGSLRTLLDAESPGGDRPVIAFDDCLREIVQDLQPVAESQGGRLVLQGQSAAWVRVEKQRLQQGLFSLLEGAMNGDGAGRSLDLVASALHGRALLAVHAVGGQSIGGEPTAETGAAGEKELGPRLALAVARRIFESAGGSLRALHCEADGTRDLRLELRLPLVSGAGRQKIKE
jgi:C4-dicarboxylate-specific signal transduction histidine kinase